MRVATIVASWAMLMIVLTSTAAAQATPVPTPVPPTESSTDEAKPEGTNDGGFSSPDRPESPEDFIQVIRTATESNGGPLIPTSDADLGDTASGAGPEADAGDPDDKGTESGVEVNPDDYNCAEYSPRVYNPEGDFYYSAVCIRWRVCGAERIDDIVSGDIASQHSTGRYRDYLDQVTYAAQNALADAGPTTIEITHTSINDYLLGQGLTDQPDPTLIPVFNWCATHDAAYNYDPFDPAEVSFAWTLTVDDVYDINTARTDLYNELTAILDLYNPEPGAVPPLQGGYTFVQWPTWFFLTNPLEHEHIYATNDTDTFRVDLRATLTRIDFHHGDTLVATCGTNDMLIYDRNTHDPIEDLPDCHHTFTRHGTADLTTTIAYTIEEQIRSRPSATLHDYPTTGWSDYYDTPTEIELTTTTPNYQIREIYTVNIPHDYNTD